MPLRFIHTMLLSYTHKFICFKSWLTCDQVLNYNKHRIFTSICSSSMPACHVIPWLCRLYCPDWEDTGHTIYRQIGSPASPAGVPYAAPFGVRVHDAFPPFPTKNNKYSRPDAGGVVAQTPSAMHTAMPRTKYQTPMYLGMTSNFEYLN